jgi:multiple sugar transport system substrate-binding protein
MEGSGIGPEDVGFLLTGYSGESPDPNISIAAEGEAADILITEGHRLAGEIGAGVFLPLDNYHRPASAEEQWALPLVSSMDVLIYNISLLEGAGLDRPPRTRSEFLQYARTLKAGPGGPYAISLGLNPLDAAGMSRDVFSWVRASGLPLIRDGRPDIGGSGLPAALEFFSQLNQEGLMAPGSFTAAGADRIGEFIRGNIAMMIVSLRELRGIREKMGAGAVGITLIPHGDDYSGKPILNLSTWYAGIAAGSPHPGEAWELLRYMRDHSSLLAQALALVPGAGSYEPYISVDPLLDKAWDMYEASDTIPDHFGPQDAGVLEAVFRRELESLFSPASPISPDEAAAAIRQSWEQWKEPEKR